MLITFKQPGTRGEPYVRARYKTLGYTFVNKRWRNTLNISKQIFYQTYFSMKYVPTISECGQIFASDSKKIFVKITLGET